MFRETPEFSKPSKTKRTKQQTRIARFGRRAPKVPGARIAARDLGCSPGHLHHVVTGSRRSPGLLARYQAWLAQVRAD